MPGFLCTSTHTVLHPATLKSKESSSDRPFLAETCLEDRLGKVDFVLIAPVKGKKDEQQTSADTAGSGTQFLVC